MTKHTFRTAVTFSRYLTCALFYFILVIIVSDTSKLHSESIDQQSIRNRFLKIRNYVIIFDLTRFA